MKQEHKNIQETHTSRRSGQRNNGWDTQVPEFHHIQEKQNIQHYFTTNNHLSFVPHQKIMGTCTFTATTKPSALHSVVHLALLTL